MSPVNEATTDATTCTKCGGRFPNAGTLFNALQTQTTKINVITSKTAKSGPPGPKCRLFILRFVPVARSYLVLLLLLNYLLVVGAGLVDRPARVIDRPFDYVHSHDCQLQHTLRLACFDDCNGVQSQVNKHGERPPLHQLLTTLKALDTHCLSEMPVAFAAPVVFENAAARQAAHAAAASAGYRGLIELPPRRG